MKKKFDLIFGLIAGLNAWIAGFSLVFWVLCLSSLSDFLVANGRAGLARLLLLVGGLAGLWIILSTKPLTAATTWLSLVFYLFVTGFSAWLTYHPKQNGL